MYRFFILCFFLSPSVLAKPAENLNILTTFSESALSSVINTFQLYYPHSDIRIIQRREASGLRLLQQKHHDIDIVLSSSPTFFQPLIHSKTLLPLGKLHAPRMQQHQLANNILAYANTGFGLLLNTNYLEKNGLQTPTNMFDLIKPEYFRHISISSPYRSHTTHLMIESILQQHGWTKGWQILYQMGGNLASVEKNTSALSEAISRGLIGVGPVVDSYAQKHKVRFPFLDFHYQPKSPLLPRYVALVNNNHPSQLAEQFVALLLAKKCEIKTSIEDDLFSKEQKDRQAFIDNTFSKALLDYDLVQQRSGLIKHLFEQTISSQLPKLNQAWLLLHSIARSVEMLTPTQHQQYLLAKSLASTSPVDVDDLKTEDYDQLPLFRDHPQVHQYRQQWQTKMAQQLKHAIDLSQAIINGNPALQ